MNQDSFQQYPLDLGRLPEGWAWAFLGEVITDIQPGFPSGKHNTQGLGVPHLRPMNIDRTGRIDLAEVKYVPAQDDARLREGDVIFNNTNSPVLIGKTASFDLPGEWAFSNHMTRLRPPEGVSHKFVAYQLHFLWMTGYFRHRCTHHVNQASMASHTLARTVPLVLAPTAEQGYIVAAIEEQFSRIDAGAGALQRARRNLQRIRTAVLQAAVTGRLVPQDTDDEPAEKLLERLRIKSAAGSKISVGWCWLRLGDLARIGSGATPLRSRRDYYEGGTIPWVKSTMLNAEFISKPSGLITEKALRETSVRLWPPGTLLVAMYGEGRTRGKCSELLFEATTNQACAAIVLDGEASTLRPFIKLHFAANYEANRRLALGGVQPNLSLGLIKSQMIALPPLPEQRRIMAEVDRQLSVVHAMDEALARSHAKVGSLRRTILSQAFSGRLLSQNPLDEPASTLLDRIRSGRDDEEPLALSQRRLRR